MRKKLLWVGDAGVPSGFARATHEILKTVMLDYDVTVLGLNYRGDPHPYPYDIWACWPGGDAMGVGRLVWMCDSVKPDVIVIQNDGWNIPMYVRRLRQVAEYSRVPVVATVAVDGQNFQGAWLDGVAHAIFWTDFALAEARAGGYAGPASVIPLGVDLEVYRPHDKAEARARRFPIGPHMTAEARRETEKARGAFIVGNVNRNQPRKRWDLMIKYFASWVKGFRVDDALLYAHVAPTGDEGFRIAELARYYGVIDRLALMEPATWYGLTEQEMADTYNCFDVNASTTQGEGFGLTALESMACGVAPVLPDWSGLGAWARGAAILVPCSTTCVGPPYVNVIGGVVDEEPFVQALHVLYLDREARVKAGAAALERARRDEFRWENIGAAYVKAIGVALAPHKAENIVRTAYALPGDGRERVAFTSTRG